MLPLLGGCEPSDEPAKVELPPVPADIKTCFRDALAVIPDRDLTRADVEALWKIDRYRAVVMRKCGARFDAWYETLRVNWR